KAMFPLSETCFHYQKKLSADQAIRLRCPENFWRVIVVSLRGIGLTSCLMRQAFSPKIHDDSFTGSSIYVRARRGDVRLGSGQSCDPRITAKRLASLKMCFPFADCRRHTLEATSADVADCEYLWQTRFQEIRGPGERPMRRGQIVLRQIRPRFDELF